MNNKGFTLIELLGVIVVLAIIIGIAIPSIMGVNKSVKDNMLEKKIKIIEEAAVLKGQDMKGSVMSSSKKYNGYSCVSDTIIGLVPTYLDSDNEECTTGNCVVDPSNADKYLDDVEVIIYFKNKRIYAKVDIDDNLTCS